MFLVKHLWETSYMFIRRCLILTCDVTFCILLQVIALLRLHLFMERPLNAILYPCVITLETWIYLKSYEKCGNKFLPFYSHTRLYLSLGVSPPRTDSAPYVLLILLFPGYFNGVNLYIKSLLTRKAKPFRRTCILNSIRQN